MKVTRLAPKASKIQILFPSETTVRKIIFHFVGNQKSNPKQKPLLFYIVEKSTIKSSHVKGTSTPSKLFREEPSDLWPWHFYCSLKVSREELGFLFWTWRPIDFSSTLRSLFWTPPFSYRVQRATDLHKVWHHHIPSGTRDKLPTLHSSCKSPSTMAKYPRQCWPRMWLQGNHMELSSFKSYQQLTEMKEATVIRERKETRATGLQFWSRDLKSITSDPYDNPYKADGL